MQSKLFNGANFEAVACVLAEILGKEGAGVRRKYRSDELIWRFFIVAKFHRLDFALIFQNFVCSRGYLAQVRKVTSKRDGKAFAAKYSPRFRAGNEITVGLHEMCILNCLASKHCPNIIQFVEGYMTEFYYVCITEL